MARDRRKTKGRRENGSFLALPHVVVNHPNFYSLTPPATKLLIDIAAQYKGGNNGDLCATWSLMQPRGWRSKETLQRATDELLARGWIEVTRMGGRHRATLYAITWQPIDACDGKLDVRSTITASNKWKNEKPAPTIGAH